MAEQSIVVPSLLRQFDRCPGLTQTMFVRGILSFLETPGAALSPRPTPEPRISQTTLTEMLREQQAKDAAVSDEELVRAQLSMLGSVPLEHQERSARENVPIVRKKMRLKTMENFAHGDICKWNARLQEKFAKKVAAYEASQRAANKREKEIKSMLGAVLQMLLEPESPVKDAQTCSEFLLLRMFAALPVPMKLVYAATCRNWRDIIFSPAADKLIWGHEVNRLESKVLQGRGYVYSGKRTKGHSCFQCMKALLLHCQMPTRAGKGDMKWLRRHGPTVAKAYTKSLLDLYVSGLPRDSPLYNLNPLHAAAKHGQVQAVRYLLSIGARVDELIGGWCSRYPALHLACAYGHGPVVEALLEGKADIDQQSQPYEEGSPGWIAHQAAVAYGHDSEVILPPDLFEERFGLEGILGAPPSASFR